MIPVIGLGTWKYTGGPEPLRKGIELGANLIDTAEMYRTEDAVGVAIVGRRDKVFLATKVLSSHLRHDAVLKAADDSLRLLDDDVIDLYQIHRLDPHTPVEETLAALDQLVRQGKVRYIGASSMYAWQFMQALALSDQRGLARFASMQNHYNLVYREEEREMLPLCEAEGVSLIPWSPLARGLLAGSRKALDDKSGTTRQETDALTDFLYNEPSDWDVVEAVPGVAKERDVPPAQIALAWMLTKPFVTAPIIGATKLSHLDDAIAATDLTLSDEEIALLEAPYRVHPVKGMGPAAVYLQNRRR